MDTKPITDCTVGELRELVRDAVADYRPSTAPVPNVAHLLQELVTLRQEVETNTRGIERLNARLNEAASVVSACPEIAAKLKERKENAREA